MSATDWDKEYAKKGIPSSNREEPSGVVLWALQNWQVLTGEQVPACAIDVGCGTARNAMHLAQAGSRTFAFDSSAVAIARAKQRIHPLLTVMEHDLAMGIPAAGESCDIVIDIFVYKHQMADQTRADYRREVLRVLKPEGRWVVSLADVADGYYSKCPPHPENGERGLRKIIDPVVGIGSVLFSPRELLDEVGEEFVLDMQWSKRKVGAMHGSMYLRRTHAFILQKA